MMISAENGPEITGQNQPEENLFYKGTEIVKDLARDALVHLQNMHLECGRLAPLQNMHVECGRLAINYKERKSRVF